MDRRQRIGQIEHVTRANGLAIPFLTPVWNSPVTFWGLEQYDSTMV